MIIFVNCKITDVKRSGSPDYNRFNLAPTTRLDVAKYCFASFGALTPIVSKFIFYLEMADGFAGKEDEMQNWLESVLPKDKLSLNWYRNNTIEQWRNAAIEINLIDDDIVYPVGNDDHAFIDSSIDLFTKGIEAIRQDPDPCAVLMTGHYPEFMRYAPKLGGHLSECENFVVFNDLNFDAMRVMKKDYFNWHLSLGSEPESLVFRTENWFNLGYGYPRNTIYLAAKEQFRHYDGYNHVFIGPEVMPALEIPPGFFEREVKIRYGFDDVDRTAVNVNPLAAALKAAEPINGVDFKFTLSDIPAFWKTFIKSVEINPGIDEVKMKQARDQHYIDMAQLSCESYQGKFDKSNLGPVEWLKNQMLITVL
jgi:hypothetical protein